MTMLYRESLTILMNGSGLHFTEGDKVILNSISMKMLQDPVLDGSIMNNSKDSAKIKFNEMFQGELVEVPIPTLISTRNLMKPRITPIRKRAESLSLL